MPALDLRKAHDKFVHGDLTVILTWLDLRETDGSLRPCLVIIPSHARMETVVPCIVTIDKAWIWSEEIGDERRAAHMAVEFGRCLGMSEQIATAIRIRGLIVDHLQDLLTMPPMPDDMRETSVLGEGSIVERESGRIVHEGEIVTEH